MTGRTIFAAAIGLVAGSTFAQSTEFKGWTGKKFPAFTATTMAGKKLTNKNLLGKVSLVDFWATWCGPCKAGMPMMQRLHTSFGKQGLMVVGADVWEQAKDSPAATKYPKANKLTYTFTKGNDALAKTLKIPNIPAVFLIDKKGVVRKALLGFDATGSEEKALNAEIKKLLAEK